MTIIYLKILGNFVTFAKENKYRRNNVIGFLNIKIQKIWISKQLMFTIYVQIVKNIN